MSIYLLKWGEQHNNIKVVFLLPPDKVKIAYIDTERKKEQRITYHVLHTAKITRHGVLEEILVANGQGNMNIYFV